MVDIIGVTAPIFILIALGYGAVRFGLFTPDGSRAMGGFVLAFALPALIFRALAGRPLKEIADAGYLFAYGAGSLATFAVVFLVSRRWQGDDRARSALKAVGASVANTGFIGFPVALAAMGPAPAGIAIALNMLIENVVMLPLGLALAESAAHKEGAFRTVAATTARRLVRTPLILAIVAGAAVSLSGLALPAPLARTVDMLANASAAVALFAIGGTLVGLRIGGVFADIGLAVAAKLFLHPLLVFIVISLLPGVGPEMRKTAVIFASVPVITIYPLLGARFGAGEMCSAVLLVQTILAAVTVTVLLAVL